ncbi:MAG: ParB N-terminal domain-containing protein, partial [Candidatus Methanomethyliaceae archaeon]
MRILPLHGVRNEYKFQYLTEAMRKHGWQGRPVLALRWGNLTQAITGSHRIAAAKKAGVNIPVY